jgi:hypothetical protein
VYRQYTEPVKQYHPCNILIGKSFRNKGREENLYRLVDYQCNQKRLRVLLHIDYFFELDF